MSKAKFNLTWTFRFSLSHRNVNPGPCSTCHNHKLFDMYCNPFEKPQLLASLICGLEDVCLPFQNCPERPMQDVSFLSPKHLYGVARLTANTSRACSLWLTLPKESAVAHGNVSVALRGHLRLACLYDQLDSVQYLDRIVTHFILSI